MIGEYLQKHTETIAALQSGSFVQSWQDGHNALLSTLQSGGKVLIAGNGGSAADAQHFSAELVGRFLLERKGYPAIALNTDSSAVTAIGNDYGFEQIYARQVEALGTTGDCFVGITTSGDSFNIITALIKAKKMGIKTILLTGRDGGLGKEMADISVIVPAKETSHIQEVHQIAYHAWCKSIEIILHAQR